MPLYYLSFHQQFCWVLYHLKLFLSDTSSNYSWLWRINKSVNRSEVKGILFFVLVAYPSITLSLNVWFAWLSSHCDAALLLKSLKYAHNSWSFCYIIIITSIIINNIISLIMLFSQLTFTNFYNTPFKIILYCISYLVSLKFIFVCIK